MLWRGVVGTRITAHVHAHAYALLGGLRSHLRLDSRPFHKSGAESEKRGREHGNTGDGSGESHGG